MSASYEVPTLKHLIALGEEKLKRRRFDNVCRGLEVLFFIAAFILFFVGLNVRSNFEFPNVQVLKGIDLHMSFYQEDGHDVFINHLRTKEAYTSWLTNVFPYAVNEGGNLVTDQELVILDGIRVKRMRPVGSGEDYATICAAAPAAADPAPVNSLTLSSTYTLADSDFDTTTTPGSLLIAESGSLVMSSETSLAGRKVTGITLAGAAAATPITTLDSLKALCADVSACVEIQGATLTLEPLADATISTDAAADTNTAATRRSLLDELYDGPSVWSADGLWSTIANFGRRLQSTDPASDSAASDPTTIAALTNSVDSCRPAEFAGCYKRPSEIYHVAETLGQNWPGPCMVPSNDEEHSELYRNPDLKKVISEGYTRIPLRNGPQDIIDTWEDIGWTDSNVHENEILLFVYVRITSKRFRFFL